ncbi:hypothetical protein [Solitalea koreensis]|uniref:hypothetical protein n=1 Tax=Solitalea koreensis TaxID=543615 RepID=UPI001158C397|nr:hypothetical protein [Solitalea koreensis]
MNPKVLAWQLNFYPCKPKTVAREPNALACLNASADDLQLANSNTLNYFRHAGQLSGVFFAPASNANR